MAFSLPFVSGEETRQFRARVYDSANNYADIPVWIRVVEAIELDPDDALAFNNKAWVLATASHAQARDGREAVRLARQAVSLDDDPGYRDTLAAAYAEAGRFDDATQTAQLAVSLVP